MEKRTERIILIGIAPGLIIFKHFLISNLPIDARIFRTEDNLMVDMAIAFRSGNRKGIYEARTLMKGTFYSIFLGMVNKPGLNYPGTLNPVNTLAALFFISRLRGLLKQPFMPSALMPPLRVSYLELIPETLFNIMRFAVTYQGMYPLDGPSGKSIPRYDRKFESITNNTAIYDAEAQKDRIAERLPHLSLAVRCLTFTDDLYRAINPAAFVIGSVCFLFLVFRLIFCRQQELFILCLIVCGLLFSLLLFAAGLSYLNIANSAVIGTLYLTSAYPLMLCSAWIPILYTIQMFLKKGQGNHNNRNYQERK